MSHPGYAIGDQPLFTTLPSIDVQALIDQAGDPWYNQTLIQVGDVLARLGVMQGELHWHKHNQQDEFFFVLDGLFRIELDGADTVELRPRQAFTVPAGMLHRPVVPARSAVLMIENRAERAQPHHPGLRIPGCAGSPSSEPSTLRPSLRHPSGTHVVRPERR